MPAKTSLKAQIYSSPFLGYTLKLVISVLRLPTRLKQLYDHMDKLDASLTHLRHQIDSLDSDPRRLHTQFHLVSRDLAEKNGALWGELAILKDLNHQVSTDTKGFRDEFLEKLTRAQEAVVSLRSQIKKVSYEDLRTPSADQSEALDSAFYAAFERHFRNDRDSLMAHYRNYRSFLDKIPSECSALGAVDLGCGRGEWLEILKSWDIEAAGVDSNGSTNETASNKNLKIYEDDALSYLKKQKDLSFKLISSFHLIEHVSPSYLVELVQESFRVLAPGGLLILETPNPENVLVGACNFHIDFTHKKPIPPASLGFVLNYCGFVQVDCLRFHSLVEPYQGPDPQMRQLIELISKGQDYAIIAQKPVLPSV